MLVLGSGYYRSVNAIPVRRVPPVIPGYGPTNPKPQAPKAPVLAQADKTLMVATVFVTLALIIVPGVLPIFV